MSSVAYSQMNINIGIDSTTVKSKTIINFLNKYFTDFKEDNKVDYSKYFFEEDIKSIYYPDKVAFGLLGNTTNYILGTPQLLSLDIKTDTVKAKILFINVDSLKKAQINFIANYYIKYDKKYCKFLITQKIKTNKWQKKIIRNVTFHYPPYYQFDIIKAQILINSIVSLEKEWGLKTKQIDYYFANTNQEIQSIKGYDFNFYMARSEYPQGLALEKENTIYCSGYGENCFHEVVHLYLNPIYPKTPIKEGIATFYGGSLGKSFQENIIALYSYIKDKPEIDISDHSKFYYVNEQINPKYIIQAFICYLVYKKNGITGLKELLKIESLDEIYQTEFHIMPDNQNIFLRKEIKKYVANKG